ncbi:MAG: hypothetical protein QM754_04540 [Tepidisphaeraceae bacterium]
MSNADLTAPPRGSSTTRDAINQPSILRVIADDTGEAFVIDAPAYTRAETQHYSSIGFANDLVLGPSLSLGYATFSKAGYKDAFEFRASNWASIERSHARLRNPNSKPPAFPPETPYTDSGDGRLAIREVRTDFVRAVYAYLVDGDTAVSMRLVSHRKNDEDPVELLRIARSARIERGFPTTQPANRRRPPTTRPISGPPDLLRIAAPDAQSEIVMNVPWSMPRFQTAGPRPVVRTVFISPRLKCTIDWGFGTFDGPATEARDRDWLRRNAATRASTQPANAPSPKYSDSGDGRLAIRTAESASGRSVIGYLKHDGAILQITLQSTQSPPNDGEDDLKTMLRIVESARVSPGVASPPPAVNPRTGPRP